MKRLIAFILLLATLTLASCQESDAETTVDSTAGTTEAPVTEEPKSTMYYVRTPKQPLEPELQYDVYEFESYEEACKKASDDYLAATGYAVYSEDGKFMYGVYSEMVTNLMYNGKHVTDYIKLEKYTYGNAATNPAITYQRRNDASSRPHQASERIVSCDRLVDWILYDSGFTDQPTAMGMHINAYMDPKHGMMGWCIDQGFEKITSVRDLQAGDIVFVIPTKPNDPNFAAHVFMCAGKVGSGARNMYYRYDGGSDERIMCSGQFSAYSEKGQPFAEGISSFVVAYRPVESALANNAETTKAD